MASRETVSIRTFMDRAEALAQFILRAGEAPRFLAFDDVADCPADTALAALEWTGVVGILLDDDLLHAAQLTAETGAALIERRTTEGRRFVYLGPRLDAAPMDVFEGRVLFEEPGVKAMEFAQAPTRSPTSSGRPAAMERWSRCSAGGRRSCGISGGGSPRCFMNLTARAPCSAGGSPPGRGGRSRVCPRLDGELFRG